jgi:two-component system OmpR family response regulator
MRVLLIEDDPMVGKGLVVALTDAGMSVDWCRDGTAGAEALAVGGHAIVLLDLGLPGKDGLTVLQEARRIGNDTPLLVITARDEIEDRIKGLDLGADDYLVKPFDPGELLARIRAVTRRQSGQTTSVIEAGAITLDLATHEVSYRGRADLLPAREFALLQALAERPGTILSRTQLEERLYGWGEEVESNAVDVLIHYVRRRFGKDIIRNVRGAGWIVARS